MTLAHTDRSAPGGTKLGDGYQSLIAFAADADVSLWEKTVTPPGVDGGDSVDTSTMHNTTYRTKAARTLKEMTDAGMSCAYDPKVYDQLIALVNVETSITVYFSDGSSIDFFGYLRSVSFAECAEGTQPECTVVIACTNTDPTSGVETGPNYNTAASS